MAGYQQLTAGQIAAGVRAGKMSAMEVAQEALRLAKTVGKELNAFITICEDKTLAQAEAIDKLPPSKRERLRLCGVPVAIKDNISYRDYPTTAGSKMLADYVPPYDATVIKRLLEAGAVIIGKTNMDEFAMGSSSESSYFGPVLHPLDHTCTPGGSSGGSASAVAAGIVPVALGSETGGSVRQPASFCGLYGLKPTYGSVSRYGLVAYCSSTDQISPFARNLDDLALIQSVIAGHDEMDSTSVDHEYSDYQSAADTERKFTIGVPKEYFGEGLDPEVRAIVQGAIGALKDDGHTIVDISLPMTEYAIPMHYLIATAEASSNLARYDGVRYGLRAAGEGTLEEMYAQTRSAGFGAEVKRRIMLGTFALSAGYYDQYYKKAQQVRVMMRREFDEAFGKVDLIVSPTAPTPAFRLGEKITDPLALYLCDVYTIPASQAGIPAISVPFGEAGGLPVGVQFMAKRFDELSLFHVARRLESVR